MVLAPNCWRSWILRLRNSSSFPLKRRRNIMWDQVMFKVTELWLDAKIKSLTGGTDSTCWSTLLREESHIFSLSSLHHSGLLTKITLSFLIHTSLHSFDKKLEFYLSSWHDEYKHKEAKYGCMYINFWRETLESYFRELRKLGMELLGLLGKAIGMEMKEVEEFFVDGMQSVRMTYYPACPKPEVVVGLTPHSDATGITILHQVNGVEGLEIKKSGVWIPVIFLPDAFVVNVGDIMEVCHAFLYLFIIFSSFNNIIMHQGYWTWS